MTLRARMTLVCAAAVAVAVALSCAVAYIGVRSLLRGQVDDQLHEQAALAQGFAQQLPGRAAALAQLRQLPVLPPDRGGAPVAGQIVPAEGPALTVIPPRGVVIPATTADRAVAVGQLASDARDTHADGQHLRVLTVPLVEGRAFLIARSLDGVDHVLTRIRLLLLVLCVAGAALAALLGRMAAERVMAPIAELSETARHVTETQDLGRRIDVASRDEVGELAGRFNAMLDALDRSQRAQRQLSPTRRTSCARR